MKEEWGTPISKDKIIDRRNRLIEYQKTRDITFSVGYQIIDENILDINYMIYEIERLNNIIKEVGEILNNKRDKMIMQQFDCDFEELLYQIDEEIREVIKSESNRFIK